MARLTPIGFFTKWILAPLLVAGFGYGVLGPRFGGKVAQKIQSTGVPLPVIPKTAPVAKPADSARASKFPPPEVSVSARPVGSPASPSRESSRVRSGEPEEEPKPKRRRRRRKPAAEEASNTEKRTERRSTRRRESKPPEVPSDPPPVIPDGG